MNRLKTVIAAFVVPLALLMSLSACGIQAGYVTDKDYKAPWTEQKRVYEQRCSPQIRTVTRTDPTTGNMRTFTETYTQCHDEWTGRYRDVYHDAEWHFDLRNDDGDEGTVEVTETQYNNYEVGDYFDKEDSNA